MTPGAPRDRPMDHLGRVGLFADLDPAVLESIAASVTPRSYARGEVLFLEGDPGDSLLVLTRGSVSVFRTSPSGERAALTVLRPPDVLGEIALLDRAARSASAEAIEPTSVLALSRPAFLALVSQQPALLEALLRRLGAMVRRLSDQAADHVFLDLAGRVAKTLVRLAGPETSGDPRSIMPVSVEVTQGRLAELAGGTRQSVNQVLGTFAARGLVRSEGRRVVLTDVAGLRRRARLPVEPPVSLPLGAPGRGRPSGRMAGPIAGGMPTGQPLRPRLPGLGRTAAAGPGQAARAPLSGPGGRPAGPLR